jgi:hypothetical protein
MTANEPKWHPHTPDEMQDEIGKEVVSILSSLKGQSA